MNKYKKFILEINLENDAFREYTMAEIYRILEKLCLDVKNDTLKTNILYDYNGNKVGIAKLE